MCVQFNYKPSSNVEDNPSYDDGVDKHIWIWLGMLECAEVGGLMFWPLVVFWWLMKSMRIECDGEVYYQMYMCATLCRPMLFDFASCLVSNCLECYWDVVQTISDTYVDEYS